MQHANAHEILREFVCRQIQAQIMGFKLLKTGKKYLPPQDTATGLWQTDHFLFPGSDKRFCFPGEFSIFYNAIYSTV